MQCSAAGAHASAELPTWDHRPRLWQGAPHWPGMPKQQHVIPCQSSCAEQMAGESNVRVTIMIGILEGLKADTAVQDRIHDVTSPALKLELRMEEALSLKGHMQEVSPHR